MSERSPERDFLRKALAPGKDCLAVEKLEMCLHGEVPPDLSLHLKECAHCRAELELLRSFYTGPRNPEEEEAVRQAAERLQMPRAILPAARRSWWQALLQVRWLSPAAVAAAVVLLVTAVGLERHRAEPRIDAPNRPEDNVLRSGRLAITAPAGDLQSVPELIQWQSVAGAAKYRVRMLEVDRSEVWSDSTADSQVEIPAAVQARMAPLKPFLLQVTAFDAGGRELAESELVRLRVLRKIYMH